MAMAKIVFNGQEYDSPEQMPPAVRQIYELTSRMLDDRDGDGVPDIMQGPGSTSSSTIVHASQFVVDGTVYASLDDMPADVRHRYTQALERFDADGDGVPDLLAPVRPTQQTALTGTERLSGPEVTVIGETSAQGSVGRALLIGVAIGLLLAIGVYLLLSGSL
jgi:hypothetical protein